MFRKIHRSVGDLDKLLRRRAMEWIAGDAEAGAVVFPAQQGMGGAPAARLARQLPPIFNIVSRHKNDNFSPAVASHNIGAPAIGLQNLTDALENEVALEVPVEIVHE